MPCGDGTGPLGLGPGMWGQGRGWCRGFSGRRRFSFYPAQTVTLTKEEQKKILDAEKESIEAELKRINEKLKELR